MGRRRSMVGDYLRIELEGKNSYFDGYWDISDKAGGFEIEFSQDEPLTLDFDLNNYSQNFVFDGSVELAQNIHFDMSWDFKEGTEQDRGYFYINKNTNDPNIEAINIVVAYQNLFGVDILVEDIQLILSVEWWKDGGTYDWSVYWYIGTITHVKILWNSVWYTLIQN